MYQLRRRNWRYWKNKVSCFEGVINTVSVCGRLWDALNGSTLLAFLKVLTIVSGDMINE